MPRFVTDIDFNGHVADGLVRRKPAIDLVRGQDAGLDGVPDALVLEWAAANDRILLTHDKSTMHPLASLRITAGKFTPGVFIVTRRMTVADAIDELLLIDGASTHAEWQNCIVFLPT